MRRWAGFVVTVMGMGALGALALSLMAPAVLPASPAPAVPRLLLYFDNDAYGRLYAKALASWLGHFAVEVVRQPVESYRRGDLQAADLVAYIGAVFDHPLPVDFLDDVYASTRPVLWLQYNLWQLERRHDMSRYGFAYEATGGVTPFPLVRYKGVDLPRDPRAELVRVRLTRPPAQTIAVAVSESGAEVPYLVRGGNLVYLAEVPFAYLAVADRSLVLADYLHEVLGQPHEASPQALIRIEDVHPRENITRLKWIADVLAAARVPFSLALIPVYRDEGRDVTVRLSDPDRAPFVRALTYALSRGGWPVLHGYTHQYDGVTRHDWEFWDERNDRPVPEASEAWVRRRLELARRELAAVGLSAYAWTTPHYMAAEEHYPVFARAFPVAYERQFFYERPAGGLLLFYPYVVVDLFGRRVLPENLVMTLEGTRSDDVLAAAERLKVVRDGVASFYLHVDVVRQTYRRLLSGIQQRGFTFVDPGPRSPVWRPIGPP